VDRGPADALTRSGATTPRRRPVPTTATAEGDDGLRELVSLASRVLGANGHDDFIWGHVSVRDPGDRGAWMKPWGLSLAETRPSDVLLVGRDGSVLDGDGPRHTEYPIHTEILAARADAGAVVHSHPPHAVALGAAGVPLELVSHAAAALVPPELPRFDLVTDPITTADVAVELAATLGEAPAALLVNHGIVTVGPDVETAVVRAIVLERACRQQLLVQGIGGSLIASSPDDALRKRDGVWSARQIAAVWALLVRELGTAGERGASR